MALLSDLITMASLHCYCFYVYATRYILVLKILAFLKEKKLIIFPFCIHQL